LKRLDSRFHGNYRKENLRTFYDFIEKGVQNDPPSSSGLNQCTTGDKESFARQEIKSERYRKAP
jgi:hypothetical protein